MPSSLPESLQIGFLGAGQMATALAGGFVRAGLVRAQQIFATDVSTVAADRFRSQTGGNVVGTIAEVAHAANLLFLSVKPQQMPDVLAALQPVWKSEHLAVSIAAGVTLQTLADALGDRARVIRVMPNTPCLIGAGASGYARNHAATPDDAELVRQLLSAVGYAVEVPERLLDAVTGLSGSGPAFVCLMIEALSDGGVKMGLPREMATRLAAQTMAGAAQLVLTSEQHPAALKDAVASPGGTTIAGLHTLEQGGLRGTLMNAVVAATERARELSGR